MSKPLSSGNGSTIIAVIYVYELCCIWHVNPSCHEFCILWCQVCPALSKCFVAGNITGEVVCKDRVLLSARRFLGNSSMNQAANNCLQIAKLLAAGTFWHMWHSVMHNILRTILARGWAGCYIPWCTTTTTLRHDKFCLSATDRSNLFHKPIHPPLWNSQWCAWKW